MADPNQPTDPNQQKAQADAKALSETITKLKEQLNTLAQTANVQNAQQIADLGEMIEKLEKQESLLDKAGAARKNILEQIEKEIAALQKRLALAGSEEEKRKIQLELDEKKIEQQIGRAHV